MFHRTSSPLPLTLPLSTTLSFSTFFLFFISHFFLFPFNFLLIKSLTVLNIICLDGSPTLLLVFSSLFLAISLNANSGDSLSVSHSVSKLVTICMYRQVVNKWSGILVINVNKRVWTCRCWIRGY